MTPQLYWDLLMFFLGIVASACTVLGVKAGAGL